MGAAAFLVVASLVLCGFVLQFTKTIRASQIAQSRDVQLQQIMIARQSLFNDLADYAKRNPDIVPVLQSAGGAPVKPATK